MDASDSGADASLPEIDSGLDPTVSFDWTETLPGQGMCGANNYVGSFSCMYEDRPAAAILVGQISLDVAETGEGETTLLVTGALRDAIGFELFFSGTINGALDCALNTLETKVDNGVATGLFGFISTFTAALDGTFDPETLEILGEIVIITDAQEVCRGSFQVGANL